MKMQRKFYDALAIIRDECEKHEVCCSECSLRRAIIDSGRLRNCIVCCPPSSMDLRNIEIVEDNDAEVEGKKNGH